MLVEAAIGFARAAFSGAWLVPWLPSLSSWYPSRLPDQQPCPHSPVSLAPCSILFIILMAFPVLVSKSIDAPAVLVSKGRGIVTQGGRMAMARGRQAYNEGKEVVTEAAAKGRQAYEGGKEAVAEAASALGGRSKTASTAGSGIGAVRPHVEVAAIPAEQEASVLAAPATGLAQAPSDPATPQSTAPEAPVAAAKLDDDVEAGERAPLPARHRSLLVTRSDGVLRTACVGMGAVLCLQFSLGGGSWLRCASSMQAFCRLVKSLESSLRLTRDPPPPPPPPSHPPPHPPPPPPTPF